MLDADMIVVNTEFLPQHRPPGWLDSSFVVNNLGILSFQRPYGSRVDMMISVPVPWILWVDSEQPEPVILAITILRFEPIGTGKH